MQQLFSSLAFSPTKCYAEKFENNYSDRFKREKKNGNNIENNKAKNSIEIELPQTKQIQYVWEKN